MNIVLLETKYSDFRDKTLAWGAFIEHYDKMGNKEVYITSLSNTISRYYRHHPEGIVGWIQKKEQSYAELEEVTHTLKPDSPKILTTLHQLGNQGSQWWRGQVTHKSFADTCNFIRTQCILNKYTSRNMRQKVNEATPPYNKIIR